MGWLAAMVIVAGGASLMLSSFVRSTTYPKPRVTVPAEPPGRLEAVDLEGDDGLSLSAWWLPPPDGSSQSAPVALMLHGNGENLETMRMAGLFEEFRRLGVGVLALDYPGYGRSGGSPSEKSLVAAADVAWAELVERAERTAPRLVIGWSLGAAVGIQTAARHPESVDGLVLVSAWSTLADTARQHFPGFLTDRLLDDAYDSLAVAGEIECPVLQIHGGVDRIIPIELGRRLHSALPEGIPESRRWVEVEGAGHNDLLSRRQVWREMEEFVSAVERRSTGD